MPTCNHSARLVVYSDAGLRIGYECFDCEATFEEEDN